MEYGYNNANEMTSAGGINYTYDGNGNLSTKGNFTYSWDYRNQLTGVVGQGFSLANVYDGDGRRVQSRSTFDARLTTVNYLWDGMNTILEFSDTGTVTDEYLNGAGEILGKIRYLPSGIPRNTITSTMVLAPQHTYLTITAILSMLTITSHLADVGTWSTTQGIIHDSQGRNTKRI